MVLAFWRDEMGRYTKNTNPKIDRILDYNIGLIKNYILKKINPKSIILIGSFGRGEGTVIEHSGLIEIVSDYEFIIVTNKIWSRLIISKLSSELSNLIKGDVTLSWSTPNRISNNRSGNFLYRSHSPSILMYESKAGGTTIHGNNYLNCNIIDPLCLPVWEGVRLIYNRMSEVLCYCDADLFLNCPKFANSKNNNWWLNKLILSCSDALLIINRKYHYSYSERLNRVAISRNDNIIFDKYYDFFETAYNLKLKPNANFSSLNVEEMFKASYIICYETLYYIANSEYLSDHNCCLGYFEKNRSAEVVEKRFIGKINVIYENLSKIHKIINSDIVSRKKLLRSIFLSWSSLIYEITPYIFFCNIYEPDCTINLRKVRFNFDKLVSLKKKSSGYSIEWQYLAEIYTDIWKLISY